MRYAIISDIHANLDALNSVVLDATNQGVEKFICLGDIVGYGPQPAETLSRVREISSIIVAGNHDDAVSGRGDSSLFINLAGDAVSRHRDTLSDEAISYLRGLEWEYRLSDDVIVSHGDICDAPKFYYIENEDDARSNFEATTAQIIFVGHTHIPKIFLTDASREIYNLNAQDFEIEDGKRYIVNPGSIGYPRELDGKCLSSYVIYDSELNTIHYRFLPFAVSSVMQRGLTPKRIKKRLLALLASIFIVICSSVAFLFMHISGREADKQVRLAEAEKNVAIEKQKVAEDKLNEVIVDKKDVLVGSKKKLQANLILEKSSDPVSLKIEYYDKNSKMLKPDLVFVKESNKKSFNIPKGAYNAKLIVTRTIKDVNVKVKSFTPTLYSK